MFVFVPSILPAGFDLALRTVVVSLLACAVPVLAAVWLRERRLDPASREGGDGAEGDYDCDGLSNQLEYRLSTSPRLPDTDGDGVGDLHEDTDGDGIANGVELSRGLDPARRDTDGDGLEDGSEEEIGTDPLQPGQFP